MRRWSDSVSTPIAALPGCDYPNCFIVCRLDRGDGKECE